MPSGTSFTLNPIGYIILCTVQKFCINRKGRTGGGGWGHPHGAVHRAAARLGCKGAMVGTGWAASRPGCMNRLWKRYSHSVVGLFLAGKAAICSGFIPSREGC